MFRKILGARNILGTSLKPCGPGTGFYRDGFCNTGEHDLGSHTVAAIMTKEFLEFSKSKGNDLSTPRPELDFPGLKPGARWCLCASRWKEAELAGKAPPIVPESTHEKALEIIDRNLLLEYSALTEHSES